MNMKAVISGEESGSTLRATYSAQRAEYKRGRISGCKERVANLRKLKSAIAKNKEEIVRALAQDFGHRASEETRLAEISTTIQSIDYTIKNLSKWMAPERRSTSVWFFPGKNEVVTEPLGVVGIMVPWNYPVNLALCPLAAALSAGNRCMIKMSELSTATETLLRKILGEEFDQDQVAVVGGDAKVAAEFASLPFDHLLFTGSSAVGRKVMAAAAGNITPVTLELGGKSPVIIDSDFPIKEASLRILWGKVTNAGQTCVAPDYALIPLGRAVELKTWCKYHFEKLFPRGARSADYTSIIDEVNFNRLLELINDAEQRGAKIFRAEELTDFHRAQKKLPFTLVINPPEGSRILDQEIFGPVLIAIEIESVDAAIDYVNERDRPLALYYFGNDKRRQAKVVRETCAGGVTINDVLLQFLQVSQPFGGVGASGFGAYHGKEGFDTFSHRKPIFLQRGLGRFTGLKLIYPPYNSFVRAIIRIMGG